MKKILLAFFLVLCEFAAAQNGLTIGSRFGIGELGYQATVRQRAMGSVSVPLLSTYDISQTNPAAWTELRSLRLQGDLSFESVNVAAPTSYSASDLQVKGFQFAIPLDEDLAIRLVGGVLPYSRVSYTLKTTAEELQTQKQFSASYEGTGGLTLFHIGSSVQPLPWLRIGADFLYYFGTIDQDWLVDYADENFFNASQTRSTHHDGARLNAGVILHPFADASIGASICTRASLRASQNASVTYSTGDSSMAEGSGTQDIPQTMRFGASYRLSKNFLVAVDYASEDWSQAVVFDAVQKDLGSMNRIGFGVEWLPSNDELHASFLEKTLWRAGFYSATSYLHLNGQSRKEFFITVGAGMNILNQNRADLAFEYGWQDASEGFLGKQSIMRLSVSVSVGESWFIRRSGD